MSPCKHDAPEIAQPIFQVPPYRCVILCAAPSQSVVQIGPPDSSSDQMFANEWHLHNNES
ncbi:MAG: hypothetical protein BVN32_14570 [Proteobacteria bacterium ST_bin14]|nr:MAG: hypothetical protein BVN32_14570 [Proteobacteria bacterium ST_bin14]